MDITDKEFILFQKLAQKLLGFKFPESKKTLIVSRLSSRIRDLKLNSFLEYLEFIRDRDNGSEMTIFINKITTNETYFFREDKHFKILNEILPDLIKHRTQLRIWSSASSTGEEPYTIAMVVKEFFKNHPSLKVQILATDISERVLEKAQSGIYEKSDIEEKVPKLFQNYFERVSDTEVKVKNEIQSMVTFKRMNLIQDRYPISHPLDIIFCRNVMIYFDEENKSKVLSQFHKHLSEDGYLFMGHSESLMNFPQLFKMKQNTVYQKVLP